VTIIWDSKLDTGIEVIDNQHKRIVAYVNQLDTARQSGNRALVIEVIEQLVDYTQSHFSFEEAMMEEAGYRFLKPHQRVHEIFIRRVGEYTVRAAKGDDVAEELHSMLTKWLINHIANEDHDYSTAVLAMMDQQKSKPAESSAPQKSGGFVSNLLGRFFR
jgi:hemerythrin